MKGKGSKKLDLKTLEHNLEIKMLAISEFEVNLDKLTSEIKLHENSIATSHKTFFERLLEIIFFGSIKYDEKYNEIINKHKEKIFKLKKNYKSAQEKLSKSNGEARQLQGLFNNKLQQFKKNLVGFQSKLLKLALNSYINSYTMEKLKVKLGQIITDNEKYLNHENISSEINEIIGFVQDPCKWVREGNTSFIKNEKIKEKQFFDSIESKPLTEKQQDAVLVNENNNLILAGAGSGKTSVIVAKVAYLIKKNILHPNQILILAFNKNAKKELSERLEKKHLHVKINTFHSFGLSVLAEAMAQKPDICPMTESSNNMTRFIKDTIHKLMASMSVFFKYFINFVTYFNIPYKSESAFSSLGEYYDYQKSYDMKTLKDKVKTKGKHQGKENFTTLEEETVKSHQELMIANFLTLNGIKYLYEEPYKHKTYTVEKRQYKPDFYLPDFDVYIEHFGIDRNNNTAPYIDQKEYLEGIEWKIAKHEECGTNLIQTFSYEFTEKKLLILLKEKLLKHNVVFRELEYAEILELLKEPIEDNKFTKLFITFLAHYKSNMHSLDDIKKKSIKIERTAIFLKLFEYIFNEYAEFQERNNCIDFNDMIVKAINAIEDNKYKHGFKHIFIDEFQDISTTRATFIKKLLSHGDVSLTAVGDDWQSINRFAGSNIKIIQEFKEIYGKSETIILDYTFRFDNNISKIASDFVQKNPAQMKKTIKTIKIQEENKFSIFLFWNTGDSKSDIETIIDLIVKREENNINVEILILARYKFLLTPELRRLKKKYENLNLGFSTVHGSKGNEADYVIILNIDKGKFGFPSRIEDDPILDMVIPEGDSFENAEERRLFYVAITRTKSAVFLLSDRYNPSSFIDEVIKNYRDDICFINDPKIKLLNCPDCKTGILRKIMKPSKKDKHFYGCSNFPRCKYTENVHYCPECNEEMFKDEKEKVARCSNENCNFEIMLCIKCNGYMIERQGKNGAFLGCSNYPKCKHTSNIIDKNSINFDNLF